MERNWGTRLRTQIHNFGTVVMPYIRLVIPNFRAAHYCYIITWVFTGSVVVYGIRNIPYIDALFLTSGASTQAGLNTIDGNKLALYQQIVVYVITNLTTPIFIHGSVLFFRLYAFERYFDNIKESSKMNFKMRRSATLAARTRSFDSTLLNTYNNQGLGLRSDNSATRENTNFNAGPSLDNRNRPISPSDVTTNAQTLNNSNTDKINSNSKYDHHGDISPPTSSSIGVGSGTDLEKKQGLSEPSDSEMEHGVAPDEMVNQFGDDTVVHNDNEGIRFGNLPQPSKRRQQEVDPSDMYKSISMLRNHHKHDGVESNKPEEGDDDEPVLVIRPPNEIENDKNPIYKERHQSKHQFGNKTRRDSSRRRWIEKRKLRKWSSKVRASPSLAASLQLPDNRDNSDEDVANGDVDTIESDAIGNDEDDDDSDSHVQIRTPGRSGDLDATNLELTPSASTGRKHMKVSHGLRGLGTFIKSPTFERLINHKLARLGGTSKNAKSNRLNRYSSAALTSDDDASFDSEGDEDEMDGYQSDPEILRSGTNFDVNSLGRVMSTNYLSWIPTVGRNSTFVHLSDEQKEELGGVEYRAVKLLIKIIVIYYVGFHITAMLLLVIYVNHKSNYKAILAELAILPTWWGFFTAMSGFNDLGLTLTPDSMTSFNKNAYVVVIVGFFVVIGNTGFPILLRFIIWVLFKCSKPLLLFKESLGFLLDHPRRCFTLLFPSVPTWWLFFILVILNGIDLVLFIILDLNNEYLEDIPVGYRIMDGLFQAFSTRTAGFSVVDLSELHPAVQVSYMLMMYISVLPLAISIRRTNVYEEQSLGVYMKGEEQSKPSNNDEEDEDTTAEASDGPVQSKIKDVESSSKSFIGTHLRNQLSFDLWFIFLGLFIICIAEGGKLTDRPMDFTVFKVLFEIISAYGTVGLSLGYNGFNTSFTGQFTTISKLVIIAMMIRGRHRGLPYSLDRAIMLPNDKMAQRDEMQENHAIQRSQTAANNTSPYDEFPLRRVFTRRPSNIGLDPRMRRNTFTSELGRAFTRNHTSDHANTRAHRRQSAAANDPDEYTNAAENHEMRDLQTQENVR